MTRLFLMPPIYLSLIILCDFLKLSDTVRNSLAVLACLGLFWRSYAWYVVGGWWCFGTGRFDKALSFYNKAVSMGGKNFPPPYYSRANCYFALRRYKEALSDLNQAIRDNPEVLRLYARSVVFSALRKPRQAIADCERILQSNSKNYSTLIVKAHALAELHDEEGAVAGYSSAIALAPNEPVLYLARAFGYNKFHRTDEALADIQKAEDILKKTVHPLIFRDLSAGKAQTLLLSNRTQEALDTINPVMKDCQHFMHFNTRGLIYKSLGRYEEAMADFDKALEISEFSYESYGYKSQTAALMGNETVAAACNELALKVGFSPDPEPLGSIDFEEEDDEEIPSRLPKNTPKTREQAISTLKALAILIVMFVIAIWGHFNADPDYVKQQRKMRNSSNTQQNK